MRNKVLEAAGLTKSFDGFIAVNTKFLFPSAKGEILGLIGPNGSGKSTISNLVAGALAPTSGSIRFRRAEIGGLPADRICQIGRLGIGGWVGYPISGRI